MLLQVADTIPHVERGVKAGELLVHGYGLGVGSATATTSVMACGQAVEESEVEVLSQERRQLWLARKRAGKVFHLVQDLTE